MINYRLELSYYESYNKCICSIEDGLNDQSDQLVIAKRAIKTLHKENTQEKKLDDLENRLRKSNLRVVGIPKHSEGSDPIIFSMLFFQQQKSSA